MNCYWRSAVVSGFFMMALEGTQISQAAAQSLGQGHLFSYVSQQARSSSLLAKLDATQGITFIASDTNKNTSTSHISQSSNKSFHPIRTISHIFSNVVQGLSHAISGGIRTIGHIASKVVNVGADLIAGGVQRIGNFISHPIQSIAHIVKSTERAISGVTSTVSTLKSLVINGIGLLINDYGAPQLISPSAQVLANSAGKVPVILIGGSFSNSITMKYYYDALEKDGIPAYSTTYGVGNTILDTIDPYLAANTSIDTSEGQLSDLVDKVQKETGAPKVNLVGYSQGGLVVKDYLAHDTKDNVLTDVNLGATMHGTTLGGLINVLNALPTRLKRIINTAVTALVGQGQVDQEANSPFIQSLNQFPETKAGIHYLNIGSNTDVIATPYQTSYLQPVPGADVTNMEVHSIPGAKQNFDHLQYAVDPAVVKTVTQYIEAKGEPAQVTPQTVTAPSAQAPATPSTAAKSVNLPKVDVLH